MATSNFQQKIPQPLYCNHDWYLLALNEYYQQTRRHDIMAKWIEEEFESNVVKVLSEKFGDKLDDQPLSVLGVGSGEGHELDYIENDSIDFIVDTNDVYDEDVFAIPRESKDSIVNTYGQINSLYYADDIVIMADTVGGLKKHIASLQEFCLNWEMKKSSDITGIEFKWHNQTFQEFERSMEPEQKYQFITIVHSMYYVGEVEEKVQTFYELLEPGGIILMILKTDSGMALLAKTFPQLAVEEQTPTTTAESYKVKTNCFITSTDVKSVLSKYQMAYTQSSYTLSADVTTCFTQDEMTPATKLVLDFITMTVKFQESVSDETFNEVMDFIKRNTLVKKSDQGGDKYYFDTECDILVISK
ncbi:histamine N-methyltransferase-like [Amphiura filiformis]|uniref:histamine N-methyltransferase-like n=1 Tax=Amphiura filiformis TaxID=82378 RepID=UPI003B21A8F1